MTARVALPVTPETYAKSPLHADERHWPEKNCYIDIWIDLTHALGYQPLAMMPFLLACDFEGDQWTFYKPSHHELYELYGLWVNELTLWRPLAEHAVEHLGAGKIISVEADAFHLPDTAGTDYQRNHVKTTIALTEVDLAAGRATYFHNNGYYALNGEDLRQTLRVGLPADPSYLPLFAEVIRLDRRVHRSDVELAALNRDYVRRYLHMIPSSNPVARFGQRFTTELPTLTAHGLAYYHQWAFATTRQLGSAAELLALHASWLAAYVNAPSLSDAASAFWELSAGCKAFILKAARAVNSKKILDGESTFVALADAWQRGVDGYRHALP